MLYDKLVYNVKRPIPITSNNFLSLTLWDVLVEGEGV